MSKEPATVTDLPERKPGESAKIYERRVMAWLRGDDIRVKADLQDWTGSLPFHLNRES